MYLYICFLKLKQAIDILTNSHQNIKRNISITSAEPMHATLKTKPTRSKSVASHDTSLNTHNHNHNHNHTHNHNTGEIMDAQSKRCLYCHTKNTNKNKYPDYLAELRRQRLERIQRKAMVDAFMESPIPMIESKNMNEEIVGQFVVDDHNFISRMSNRVSQYQQTPKKSILQSFHQSIIKSHTQNSLPASLKNEAHKSSHSESFRFEIRVENPETGHVYFRGFTAPEYGEQAVKVIEDILGSQC